MINIFKKTKEFSKEFVDEMKKVEKIAASIEEQYMTTEKVPLENVHELITSGRITDAKTIIGIYSALQRIGE